MPSFTIQATTPRQTLLVTRIVWAALIVGVVAIGTVLMTVAKPPPDQPTDSRIMQYMAVLMPAAAVPVAFLMRGLIMKRGRQGEVVAPGTYFTAHIVAYALCEGTAMTGLIFCFVAGQFVPWVLGPGAALAAMVLMWPNGRAMYPPSELDDNPYRRIT